jgi:hypothetical protein
LEYFARMINRGKWDSVSYNGLPDIQADAMTVCLRTSSNELSVWQCDTARSDVSEVVLALALADKKDRIDKMHVVLVHQNDIENDGISQKSTLGNTLVIDLRTRHRDLINLTMTKICMLARRISVEVENYADQERAELSCSHSFTKTEVTNIIRNAIKDGRVKKEELPEKIKNAIEK